MKPLLRSVLGLIVIAVGAIPSAVFAQESKEGQAIDIGQRLELFVDRQLVEKLEGVEFRLHEPQAAPLPRNPLPIVYTTVIKDGNLYRAYYRESLASYVGPKHDGHPGEVTCYAESRDGHEWTFPDLGISDVASANGKNLILEGAAPFSHNFSPFLDARPDAKREERFKALAGSHRGGGLYAFASADGIHWKKMLNKPVITSEGYGFDSQNVSFWSTVEKQYVCYFRTLVTPHGQLRTISRTTSKDYLNWTEAVAMNPNLPDEHLYTNQTHPYFRAPHLYIALPTRFVPKRGSSTDILFMATRAGSTKYERLFTEAFIRPGLDKTRWGNRSNYLALNVVPTGPAEMSIYHKSGHRYVLRTDGFVSARVGSGKGELLTKVLKFSGKSLVVNFSTSAVGSLQVEIQDAQGKAVPGYGIADCPEIVGDDIAQTVRWKESTDVGELIGKPIRLRFVMTQCDLYSFRFK